MSEQEATTVESEPEAQQNWGSGQNGLVKGIPGKHIALNGVLDLRGVSAEEIKQIETLVVNGVVLLDESNNGALADVRTNVNGSIMTADPSMRVMVQPDLEMTRTMVEAMPAGQKLLVIGIITVSLDIPPALLAEKFDDLRLVGVVIIGEAAMGALFGRSEITGVSVTLGPDSGPVVRNIGSITWSVDYLTRLQDGSTFVNVGSTEIASDVPEELVAAKVGTYHNVGSTSGPHALLELLRSRCRTNLGSFDESDAQ